MRNRLIEFFDVDHNERWRCYCACSLLVALFYALANTHLHMTSSGAIGGAFAIGAIFQGVWLAVYCSRQRSTDFVRSDHSELQPSRVPFRRRSFVYAFYGLSALLIASLR